MTPEARFNPQEAPSYATERDIRRFSNAAENAAGRIFGLPKMVNAGHLKTQETSIVTDERGELDEVNFSRSLYRTESGNKSYATRVITISNFDDDDNEVPKYILITNYSHEQTTVDGNPRGILHVSERLINGDGHLATPLEASAATRIVNEISNSIAGLTKASQKSA